MCERQGLFGIRWGREFVLPAAGRRAEGGSRGPAPGARARQAEADNFDSRVRGAAGARGRARVHALRVFPPVTDAPGRGCGLSGPGPSRR